jgi:chromosome segregation ATPase
MTDNTENLILEHLKRFQAGQDRIERELKEIKSRITTLKSIIATIMQYLAHMSGSIAEQHVRYDSLLERIERIERRLELTV